MVNPKVVHSKTRDSKIGAPSGTATVPPEKVGKPEVCPEDARDQDPTENYQDPTENDRNPTENYQNPAEDTK